MMSLEKKLISHSQIQGYLVRENKGISSCSGLTSALAIASSLSLHSVERGALSFLRRKTAVSHYRSVGEVKAENYFIAELLEI